MKGLYLLAMSCLTLWLYTGCQSSGTQQTDQSEVVAPSLPPEYAEGAIAVLDGGAVMEGATAIQEAKQPGFGEVQGRHTLFSVDIGREGEFTYAIDSVAYATGRSTLQLLILDNATNPPKRLLEYTGLATPSDTDMRIFDERRQHWMERCNAHNAAKLVEDLYSTDALYYNHKPLIIGREAISETYGYMNRSDYQLTLHPLVVKSVHADLTYEIGYCTGSYGGNYLLVWQQTPDGKWEIYLDSNL